MPTTPDSHGKTARQLFLEAAKKDIRTYLGLNISHMETSKTPSLRPLFLLCVLCGKILTAKYARKKIATKK